jgi:uncharacterized membrane protein (DUF485 family)
LYEAPQYSGGRKLGPHQPGPEEPESQEDGASKAGRRADDPLAAGPRKPLPARIRPGNPRPEGLRLSDEPPATPAPPAAPAARNALEETGQMPGLFTRDRITYAPAPAQAVSDGPDFAAIQRTPAFTDLRSRLRRFIFPMSLLFFAWYMTYVLLAAYAHDFMSEKVFGEVNVAMLFGLGQFATTVLFTIAYVRYARRHVDPQVALIREQSSRKDQPGAATL